MSIENFNSEESISIKNKESHDNTKELAKDLKDLLKLSDSFQKSEKEEKKKNLAEALSNYNLKFDKKTFINQLIKSGLDDDFLLDISMNNSKEEGIKIIGEYINRMQQAKIEELYPETEPSVGETEPGVGGNGSTTESSDSLGGDGSTTSGGDSTTPPEATKNEDEDTSSGGSADW